MQFLKWGLILIVVFIATILASPWYVILTRLDRAEAEKFLDHMGECLASKLKRDLSRKKNNGQ